MRRASMLGMARASFPLPTPPHPRYPRPACGSAHPRRRALWRGNRRALAPALRSARSHFDLENVIARG